MPASICGMQKPLAPDRNSIMDFPIKLLTGGVFETKSGKNGARGGRTLTVSPPTDFKSVASADSAIAWNSCACPVCVYVLPYMGKKIIIRCVRKYKRARSQRQEFMRALLVQSFCVAVEIIHHHLHGSI